MVNYYTTTTSELEKLILSPLRLFKNKKFKNDNFDLISTGVNTSISKRIYKIKNYIKSSNFLLLNGDAIFYSNLNKIFNRHLKKKLDMSFICSETEADFGTIGVRNGKIIKCRDWIKELLVDVTPLAKELDMFELIKPIESVLINGNQSMIWLESYSKGVSIQSLLQKSISAMEQEEKKLFKCSSASK